MMGRKSVIGLAVLCALAFAAITAASASAAPGRAWTCKKVGPGNPFNDEHCINGTGGEYKHEEIPNGLPKTTIVGTNAKTASGTTAAEVSKLKGHIAGIATEVQCTGVSGTGELENSAGSVSGSGEITYSGCTVTLPAGRECVVTGGEVKTKPLAATTAGLTNPNELEFKMAPGETEFATIPIKGCKENSPPAGSYPVAGSLIATTSGATTTTVHNTITTQGNLTFGGNAAGLQGALTISMSGAGGNPIVLT
jgi:hypothetical protein